MNVLNVLQASLSGNRTGHVFYAKWEDSTPKKNKEGPWSVRLIAYALEKREKEKKEEGWGVCFIVIIIMLRNF